MAGALRRTRDATDVALNLRPDTSDAAAVQAPEEGGTPACHQAHPAHRPRSGRGHLRPHVSPGKGRGRQARSGLLGRFDLEDQAEPQNGRIEVEVDQKRVGVTWNVTLRQNTKLVASTTATTQAPSGSFTVRRFLPNEAGPDSSPKSARVVESGEVRWRTHVEPAS